MAAAAALPAAARAFLARHASPLNPRPALLGVDYGTTKLGLAWAAGLTSEPAPLPLLRTQTAGADGE